jgi:hypothetical protein
MGYIEFHKANAGFEELNRQKKEAYRGVGEIDLQKGAANWILDVLIVLPHGPRCPRWSAGARWSSPPSTSVQDFEVSGASVEKTSFCGGSCCYAALSRYSSVVNTLPVLSYWSVQIEKIGDGKITSAGCR